jgi:hypothetical protein
MTRRMETMWKDGGISVEAVEKQQQMNGNKSERLEVFMSRL